MDLRVIILSCLVAVFGWWLCVPSAQARISYIPDGGLDSHCMDVIDCQVNNPTCDCSECVCEDKDTKYDDTSGKFLGSTCNASDPDACAPLANAECDEAEVCSCTEGYTQYNKTLCVRGIGNPCNTSTDEVDKCFDDGISVVCDNGTCQCLNETYIALPNGLGCVVKSCDLGSPCDVSSVTECKGKVPNSLCDNNTMVFTCKEGFTQINKTFCGRELGSYCMDDGDCKVNNSICNCNKCVCKANYMEYDLFCGKFLGSTCNADDPDACAPLANAECNKEVCSCTEGYTQYNKTLCVRGIGDPCKNGTDQEYKCYEDEISVVCNGTCECLNETYIPLPNGLGCVVKSCDLGSPCDVSSVTECKGKVPNSLCDNNTMVFTCEKGFTQINKTFCGRGVGDHCEEDDICQGNGTTTLCVKNMCQCINNTYIKLPDNTTCVLKAEELGMSCDHDVQCTVEHSGCIMSNCECTKGYAKFNTTYCGRGIGQPCNEVDPFCPDVENSVCEKKCENKTSGVSTPYFLRYLSENEDLWSYAEEPTCDLSCVRGNCACDNTTTYSNDNLRCVPISTEMNSSCEVDRQCTLAWGGMSECKESYCACKFRYIFNEKECLFIIPDIGGDCLEDVQCSVRNSECRGGVCMCTKNFEEVLNNCVAFLGGTCNSTEDCAVGNSTCTNEKCICQEGYTEITPSSCGRGIGDTCDNVNDPCVDTSNVSCINNKCHCDSGYVPSVGLNRCLPISDAIYSSCEISQQCTERWGENSTCLEERCQCKPGFANDNSTCLAKVPGLNMACETDGQCSVEQAVCDSLTKQCRCAYSFTAFNSSYCGTGVYDDCRFRKCEAVESTCSLYGWCICNNGFVASSNDSQCLKQSYIDGPCVDPIQCRKAIGTGSTCYNYKCACLDQYKYNGTRCTLYVSKLNEPCDVETQGCYLEKSGGFNRTRCKDGLCQCREQYFPSSDKLECVSDSSSIVNGSLLMIVATMMLTSISHRQYYI